MIEHNHAGEWMAEIRRGKVLGSIVEEATVTDTDGATVDVAAIRPDGTLAEPAEDAAEAPAKKAPAKKAPAKKAAKAEDDAEPKKAPAKKAPAKKAAKAEDADAEAKPKKAPAKKPAAKKDADAAE